MILAGPGNLYPTEFHARSDPLQMLPTLQHGLPLSSDIPGSPDAAELPGEHVQNAPRVFRSKAAERKGSHYAWGQMEYLQVKVSIIRLG